MNFYDIQKNNWKISAGKYDVWASTGERNLFIARFLQRKYNKAYKIILKKSNKFRSEEITSEEWALTNIYPAILMFYGLALECYLKALLIKLNLIKIFDDKDPYKLNDNLIKHLSITFYERYKQTFPEIDDEGKKHIKLLHRAILSGKYPFEKTPSGDFPYTSDFDNTIVFSKKIINDIKVLLKTK